jgi:hypothetical protein
VVDAAASDASVIAGRLVRERSNGAQDERRRCVRQNRVVLAPVAGVKLAEVVRTLPGFRSALNPSATVTRRIRRRGERGISRKAIAQGMPECPDCTCMLVCVSLCAICTRDRGCSKHPAFPAPSSLSRDKVHASLGLFESGENAESYFVSRLFHPRRPGQASQRVRPSAGPMTGSASAISDVQLHIGDPYAAADIALARWWTACFNTWRRWLWVPAFAGTTALEPQPQLRSACRPLKVRRLGSLTPAR